MNRRPQRCDSKSDCIDYHAQFARPQYRADTVQYWCLPCTEFAVFETLFVE